VSLAIALGILAGTSYAVLHQPMLTSTALVLLPPSPQNAAAANGNAGTGQYTATQEVIAGSNQVLSGALHDARPAMSLNELRQEIQIGNLTQYIISVTAKGKVAADLEATANAVANSYIRFIGSATSPVGHVSAQLLQPATLTTGSASVKELTVYILIGAVFGALIGIIVSVAVGHADRRLRSRDEIANSIGVPVVASFPVAHPTDARGWAKLLEDYKPGALHALQLRKALQLLPRPSANVNYGGGSGRSSLTVLSLSSDPGALALGPQLAVFAASQGIPTALVIGPQQDQEVTAALRTACAVPAPESTRRPSQLRVTVSDDYLDEEPNSALTVVIVTVDGRTPRMPEMTHTTVTVLGVSAGTATAEQLARVAVSAADGREITGILVADPDSSDQTTGRVPQLVGSGQRRMPTRLTGITTELRR
jgi:capsular polysaccharide biosynthesis protein